MNNNSLTEAQTSTEAPSEPSKITRASKTPLKIGSIQSTIGEGDNAKNSIVWVSIRWSLAFGIFLSLLLVVRKSWNCGPATDGELISQIKEIWSIFMPIVTLALGYVFGKGR